MSGTSKYGVISDIHANYRALKTALDHFEAAGAEKILCLGDILGYGPDPQRCIETLCYLPGLRCVCGNTDRQQRDLDPQAERFIRALPRVAVEDDLFVLVHCGLSSEYGYIQTPADFHRNLLALESQFPQQSICFFGHTHIPAVIGSSGVIMAGIEPGTVALERGRRYLINPGSAGQPRGNSSRGSCGIFDAARWEMTFLRIDY